MGAVRITGVTYAGEKAFRKLLKLRNGDKILLKAEPNNEHDPNAVAAYAGDTRIGYVPKNVARVLDMSNGPREVPIIRMTPYPAPIVDVEFS